MPFRQHSDHNFDIEVSRRIYDDTRQESRHFGFQNNDIILSPLEQAGDELAWAIESVIDQPREIKRWFLVKDALKKYKDIRKDRF